ncbi:MAG: DASS family sodium-coupled anion symporter [Negativicutes bacterium]|nr:DASS family sodium-coupled anion symporter [Negativicutes bacterium]
MDNRTILKLVVSALVAVLFFVIPAPAGLKIAAWHLFGIFLAAILALILQPLPEAAVLLLAVTAAGMFAVPLKDVLVGYTDSTLWLIVVAVMISIGFKKSGLARRIGLSLISRFGTTSLRLGYILSFLDLLLATSTPAAPARGGGIVFPLAEGVIEACDCKPGATSRRIGAYLTVLMYTICMTTGSIFMTGMGPNLLNVKLAQQTLGIDVTWSLWAVAALPGFIGFLLIPYLLYKVYPPQLTDLGGIRRAAADQLAAMGPVTRNEYFAAFIFLTILTLWATGSITMLDATLVAFIGISLMLLLRVVEWKDIAEAKEAWAMLTWFGAILGLSAGLAGTGFFSWFAVSLKQLIPTQGLETFTVLVIITLLATLPHYLFASLVGYVAAFAPLLFSFIAATGVPKYPAFFLAAFLMVISSTLTHYGNGLGPLLFAKGYTDKKAWWLLGLMVTALHAILYLTVGTVYWKLIGLWY